MVQGLKGATDRLISIIQTIQLVRGVGVLAVVRGEGIIAEEGTIVFMNGQVTEARTGRRSGIEALNYLSTWEACRYSFLPLNSLDFPRQMPVPLPDKSPDSTYQKTPAKSFLSQATSPLKKPPLFDSEGGQPIDNTEGTAQDEVEWEVVGEFSAFEQVVPFQTKQREQALRLLEDLRLSRFHRWALLLIDGQRSVAELERLMGRSQAEIRKLLRDLEKIGVIQVPIPSRG